MVAALAVSRLSESSVKTLGDAARVRPLLPLRRWYGCRMKLLLVEDNPTMSTTLQRALQRQGMTVHVCNDGVVALGVWRSTRFDAVLLDLSLPGQDGLELLAQARAAGLRTPVIILTARGTVGDRILGLNTGADDYLAKPFDLDELEARVRALVRRTGASANGHTSGRAAEQAPPPPRLGGLYVDTGSGAVYLDNQPMDLTPRELALLRVLLARPGQAISKERLFEQVFAGEADVSFDAIEVVVYRLRKKLADTGVQLVTLRGLGYLLKASA